jgi:hypothetical protein
MSPVPRFFVFLVFFSFVCRAQEATVRGRVVDVETGELVPCTITIATSAGRVIEQQPSFRGGFRSNGNFNHKVPPGPATITVSRGFDFAAVQRKIDLKPGEEREFEFLLRRRTPLRKAGWICGDNHVHMIHGERTISVNFLDIALAARAEGLDYLSVCQQWNLPRITPEDLDAAGRAVSRPDFLLTWNLEAPKNYWRGDASHCVGHGWTLGMRGRAADGGDAIAELLRLSAGDYESEKTPVPNFEMHDLIHSLGGIVSYTHPHRSWTGKWGGRGIYPVEENKYISNVAAELPFDTMAGPTYDTIDVMMQAREREVNRRAQELWFMLLNQGYRIAATASTDPTFDNPGGGVPGKVRVYTLVEGERTPSAIAQAVKRGRSFVTTGPLLVLSMGSRQAGDIVKLKGPFSTRLTIEAWASGHAGERLTRVELIRKGRLMQTFTAAGPHFRTTVDIGEAEDSWYVARCYGSTDDQVAITNPIWFETAAYVLPPPVPARVSGRITDRAGKPLDGTVEVVRMNGSQPVVESQSEFRGGEFHLTAPATARLRVRAPGHAPLMKSIYMDYQPLLNLTLNVRAAQLSDWQTFETVRRLLGEVRLDFALPD